MTMATPPATGSAPRTTATAAWLSLSDLRSTSVRRPARVRTGATTTASPPADLVAHVARAREARVDEPLGGRRARLAALGVGVGQLDAVGVEEGDAAAHAARELAHDGVLARRAAAQVAARQPCQPEVGGARELAHVAQAIGGEPVLERGHERRHGRGERHRAAWPAARSRTAPASRACASASALGPQPVSRPANGDDELRVAAGGGELVAQEVDVDVDGARVAELVAAEDRVEQLLAREQAAARAQQRIEDLELGVGERQLGAVELDAARVGVQAQPRRGRRPPAGRR